MALTSVCYQSSAMQTHTHPHTSSSTSAAGTPCECAINKPSQLKLESFWSMFATHCAAASTGSAGRVYQHWRLFAPASAQAFGRGCLGGRDAKHLAQPPSRSPNTHVDLEQRATWPCRVRVTPQSHSMTTHAHRTVHTLLEYFSVYPSLDWSASRSPCCDQHPQQVLALASRYQDLPNSWVGVPQGCTRSCQTVHNHL